MRSQRGWDWCEQRSIWSLSTLFSERRKTSDELEGSKFARHDRVTPGAYIRTRVVRNRRQNVRDVSDYDGQLQTLSNFGLTARRR